MFLALSLFFFPRTYLSPLKHFAGLAAERKVMCRPQLLTQFIRVNFCCAFILNGRGITVYEREEDMV